MSIKSKFIQNLNRLDLISGYTWELIDARHSDYILQWRNNSDNLNLFENQTVLTKEGQEEFLRTYHKLDRVDLILMNDHPIGVFNIKNLETFPEYGALIGDNNSRGKGLGFEVKKSIFRYWFTFLEMDKIYIKNKIENEKLILSNQKLGFKTDSQDSCLITMVLDKSDFNRNVFI